MSQIYSEGAVQTGLNDNGCPVDATFTYYVAPPVGPLVMVDQETPLEQVTYGGGFFTYDLISDDNKNPTQFPAGTYIFYACSANCVSFSMNLPQNPITTPNHPECGPAQIGDPNCPWYARDSNTISGKTTTYDDWGGQLYGPSYDNSLQSDRVITQMVATSDNTPGDSGAIYGWVAGKLNNPPGPPGANGFVQVGIKYQGNGVYDAFFYTESPVSNMCTGSGTVAVGTKECDHPISASTPYSFDMHSEGTTMYVGINGVPFAEYAIPAHDPEKGMSAFYTIAELPEIDTNTFQATLNGHLPFSSTFYPALKADIQTDFIEYEAGDGVTDYQFNAISPIVGQVFAPFGGATGTETDGKMDCGAVSVKSYADFGGSDYTTWFLGVRTSLTNHC